MKSTNKGAVVVTTVLLLIEFVSSQVVQIDDGPVQGTIDTTPSGRSFNAFYRIPFAQPPVGNLRFAAPVRANPWTTVFDASSPGPICFQIPRQPTALSMSEDCLHINVFSPNLLGSLPVIVYVFGGGFVYGSGLDQGRPHYLMDREVVVVHFNYRLGALGFLALGTSDIPGNAAMKDQVLALEWVQRNIASFGGNRDSVTIAGLSAGGISVTGHMLSPMTQGLFHKVISMSGAISTPRTGGLDTIATLAAGRRLASSLNCSDTENIDAMVTCLRGASAGNIVAAVLDNPPCTGSAWRPVVEPDFGQLRYLTQDPDTQLGNGNFSIVPVLIGITADEFAESVPGLLNSPTINNLNENFYATAPCVFNYEQNTARSRAFSDILRQSFLPLAPIDVRSFDPLKKLLNDGLGYSSHRFVHHITNHTDVYYYKFSYVGERSLFTYPGEFPFGVNHADDLQYTFNAGPQLIPEGHRDHFMVLRMTRIWENFATTGNPNYDPVELNWPKHNVTHEFYMDIGRHMIEKHGLFLDRYTIWDTYESSSAIIIGLEKVLLLLLVSSTILSWL